MSPIYLLAALFSISLQANTKPEMQNALKSLDDLLPFIAREEKFLDKKNEKEITQGLTDLEKTFRNLKHDQLLKNELFAPSYAIIRQNLSESLSAFKAGNKDYSHWRLTEITQQCLDCHTRLPSEYKSDYQTKRLRLDPKKFDSSFDLGTAQFIVRDYKSAHQTFLNVIEEGLKNKNYMDMDEAFKNILTINTKIEPNNKRMLEILAKYLPNKSIPMDLKDEMLQWEKSLKETVKIDLLQKPLKDDKEVSKLISTYLENVKEKGDAFLNNYDVYLLTSSGNLSRYLFANPDTGLHPEISYWLGWTEKVLKRDSFFGSGDLFLKQCVRKYPKSKVAPKCLEELKESAAFEFSGSSGTQIPADVKKELSELESLITK